MKAAMARGVDLMIFNSLHELNKIQKSAPKARLILSLESSGNVEKAEGWQDLLLAARDFGLQVVGVALTRNNNQADQFCKLIAWTRMVIAIGRSMGHDMSIVDIGPLDHPGADPEQIQTIIKQNLNDLDVHLQGHVGTAFIENVFSCIVKVIGKRAGQDRSTLIINDGIFNSFGRLLIDHQFIPDSITSLSSSNRQEMCKEEVKIDIFGSSGDDMDIIVQEQILNFNVEEEDWLLFSNMGAFSYTLDADMASVALPSKYGKFRIFTPNDADIEPENDILEENNIIAEKSCKFFMDELNTDIIEVIFLDVNNNNNENEKADEQCILELFEELPLPVVVGEGDEDDEEGLLWADYLTNIH
jgi:diaminopimelate decarboxylase